MYSFLKSRKRFVRYLAVITNVSCNYIEAFVDFKCRATLIVYFYLISKYIYILLNLFLMLMVLMSYEVALDVNRSINNNLHNK